MAGSITEHVIKLQELTQKNLEILQALNDSFFTNQNHLSVKVGDNQYAIPSFISLENKINSLTANFHNLVNAPESGEAFFNFDGNSRSIEVRSYNTTPSSLTLKPVETFNVESNDIFKDFLTPNPYIHIDVQELPNDTTQVLVKKIIPLNSNLKQIFESNLSTVSNRQRISKKSTTYPYKDLYKILSQYVPDVDYIEYDTKLDLPIRKNIGTGTYVIEEILEDYVDDNLINYITIKLRSDLTPTKYMNGLKYSLFDETIEKPLKVGDQLVTFEGNAKMEITELRTNTNTVVVKVLNGEFLNLVPSYQIGEDRLIGLNKLCFYSPIDFNEDKYVKVSLEEDQYIFIAIAALNSRMNVQSSWGNGLMVDAHSLTNYSGDEDFKTYYKENVQNIGDVLFEITSMLKNTLTKYSGEEYNSFTQYQPTIDLTKLKVVPINDHLNNSEAVQNIRSLYTQKKELQAQLSEIQAELNGLNEVLSTISFDDTTGRRVAYTTQISSLNSQRNEITSSITKIMDEIAMSANNSELPIENAKYRIRGYFNTNGLDWKDHIKGIRVQYKYKNIDTDGSNKIRSIDENFTFSDWNEMKHFDREPITQYRNGKIESVLPADTSNGNDISFQQIDIPISQGEVVEMRLKILYDFGAPFVQTTSLWSPTVTVNFPAEYLKDVKILDIISENNNDIEANRFKNILDEENIPDHIGDKITDQDMVYYHKPENIASGFYTEERRIIPLKDKLMDLNNIINQLKDDVYGTSSDSLKVSLINGSNITTLIPHTTNRVYPEAYSNLTNGGSTLTGNYEIDANGMVTTVFNLVLTNDSNHTLKLFSMFPGNRDTSLKSLVNYRYKLTDYCQVGDNPLDVWYEYASNNGAEYGDQKCNQFIYFRLNDANTGVMYYGQNNTNQNKSEGVEPVLGGNKDQMKYTSDKHTISGDTRLFIYPSLDNEYGLCLNSSIAGDYIVLNPQQELVIPMVVEYYILNDSLPDTYRTISFDILPSLYKDPINYQFTIIAKKNTTVQDKVMNNNSGKQSSIKYNSIYR